MAYLIQTQEHATAQYRNRHAQLGDIVVAEDFRAVYTTAKDGSRRRIKDKKVAERFVNMCKTSIAKAEEERVQRAIRNEALRIQREAGPDAPETLVIEPHSKSNAAAVVAMLAAGLTMEAGLPYVGA